MCQADAEPSLAHTAVIQEKGFQTIKCNRQRDQPHERAATAQPASAAEQSLLETGACAGEDAQDLHAPACSGMSLVAPKQ